MQNKKRKQIETRPPPRNRYGFKVPLTHFAEVMKRVSQNDDIGYYCIRDEEIVVEFRKRAHRTKYIALVHGLEITTELVIRTNGKMTTLYPKNEGWQHVNKDEAKAKTEDKAENQEKAENQDRTSKQENTVYRFRKKRQNYDIINNIKNLLDEVIKSQQLLLSKVTLMEEGIKYCILKTPPEKSSEWSKGDFNETK